MAMSAAHSQDTALGNFLLGRRCGKCQAPTSVIDRGTAVGLPEADGRIKSPGSFGERRERSETAGR